ncbi:lytic transglycosylase domain-containing protein [Chromobacterium haemolyticum]|uniref:lytic transglycosylase domain-containing protein n=1 Tax=Chromobacterium haemolyticum TaxID=394935 RepID=UPI0009DAE43C|nr:lytic transglycosylase domain-containing protein [Chromobacterium haemolyticum]MDH0341877.1 lytic transglycosylase domain-containing protein [Chromobacterium haemolyticum]OQS37047.1 transglycosylase [Chromobacterium haemolyticum]PTU69808.1 transglycosylase [Chromobacterium haemolyticum]BBH15141.1 transglycosylase [Chromobacterium haemolyticum]
MIRSGIVVLLAALAAMPAWAGAQKEEALAANVASTMRRSVSDANAPRLVFDDQREADAWLGEMSSRLAKRIPDKWTRERLLTAIHYEATRAGLDPQLVLGLIQVESGFNKYAISGAGARGLMQVMPFWVRSIGNAQHNLFDLTTNLRYGCTILRYYLDIERGNLFRALGRYNGSLGRAEYPNLVMGAWKGRWHWVAPLPVKTAAAGAAPSLVR